MKKIFAFFGLFFVLFILSGCTFQTKHRGYVFPDNLESEIKNVKTTQQLTDVLGSPQTKTIYGKPIWVYYSVDENYHGPMPVTYDDKKVLLVYSDAKGNITNTKILTDDDLKKVKPADGETEIPAAIELNALQELFNNIGRFSPAGLGQ